MNIKHNYDNIYKDWCVKIFGFLSKAEIFTCSKSSNVQTILIRRKM